VYSLARKVLFNTSEFLHGAAAVKGVSELLEWFTEVVKLRGGDRRTISWHRGLGMPLGLVLELILDD
jgi:hypothetical protein